MKKHARHNFFIDVNGIIEERSSNNPKEFWKLIKVITKPVEPLTRYPHW